jgi:hypothetical protein
MAPQEALVLNEQPVPRLVDESAEPIPPGSRTPDDVAFVGRLEGLAVPVGLEAFDDLGHLVTATANLTETRDYGVVTTPCPFTVM